MGALSPRLLGIRNSRVYPPSREAYLVLSGPHSLETRKGSCAEYN